jgi:RNA polymerase sigma factor (sigma-70 family)
MAGSYVNLQLVPNRGAARGAEPSMSDRPSRSQSAGEEWTHDARSRLVEELFAAHRTALLQYLTRLLHSSEAPEEIVDWDAGMVVLKQALLDLPPRHRQVFLLHVTENMSYRTIAKHLGVSTKTVERDLAMVLELCQSRLRTMESK